MVILEERKQERRQGANEELQRQCLCWFNNHMTVILMAIQYIHGREAPTIAGIEFFLHDIEHHFIRIEAGQAVRHAFRYLKRYFKCYPRVTPKHSKRAVEMVRRIYSSLGLELNLQSYPVLTREDQAQRKIAKVLATCLVALRHVLHPHDHENGETHGK